MAQKEQQSQLKKNDLYELTTRIIGRTQSLSRGDMIILRRSQGLTSDKLSAVEKLRFYSLFANDDGSLEIPYSQYLKDCLLFGVQIACSQDGDPQSDIKLQDLIAAEYRDAPEDSSKAAKIEAFMSLDGHDNKLFFKELARLIAKLTKKKKKIDVYSLTYDLIKWDDKFGGKERWLRAITRIYHDSAPDVAKTETEQ